MSERTNISPRSNIGELAAVFDTMAGDVEDLLNQQRDLLNAVSHELRTPLTRLDFGLALALSEICRCIPRPSARAGGAYPRAGRAGAGVVVL